MKLKTIMTTLALSTTFAVGALAQQGEGGAASNPPRATAGPAPVDDNVQYKAKTVYDFEDDMVEGDLQRPDGELIDSVRKAKHSSLIEIRSR